MRLCCQSKLGDTRPKVGAICSDWSGDFHFTSDISSLSDIKCTDLKEDPPLTVACLPYDDLHGLILVMIRFF